MIISEVVEHEHFTEEELRFRAVRMYPSLMDTSLAKQKNMFTRNLSLITTIRD